jgi:hypothetical protein
VTPRSSQLSANETVAFTALGRVSNGTNAAIGVNWTAIGGTIDPAGGYQAGSTVGKYVVMNILDGGVQDLTGAWDCPGTGIGMLAPDRRVAPSEVRVA